MTKEELEALGLYVEEHSKYVAKVWIDTFHHPTRILIIPRHVTEAKEAMEEAQKQFLELEIVLLQWTERGREKYNVRDD